MGCFSSKPKKYVIEAQQPVDTKDLLFYSKIEYQTSRTEVQIPIKKKFSKTQNGKAQQHNIEHLDELIARINDQKWKPLKEDSLINVNEIYQNLSENENLHEISIKKILSDYKRDEEFKRKYVAFLDPEF